MLMLVFYILVSVELIAEAKDPFGVDENDLPLDDMCATIRANTDEILSRG